jgi:excisionase family DNA binding protein
MNRLFFQIHAYIPLAILPIMPYYFFISYLKEHLEMLNQFYTVEQISHMVNIHPKTIQRYIREGKLRATKIGKSWRITGHDLSLFAEENMSSTSEESTLISAKDRIKITSVIDIKVTSKDEAYRIINTLNAAMNNKPPEYGEASLASQFVESESNVRLTLWGNLQFMRAIFTTIEIYSEQKEE